jgi:hypothetical protein
MDAKNQATQGLRSSGSTGGAGSSCAGSSCVRGSASAAASNRPFMRATKPGKTAMPKRSSKAPKLVTAARKPTEPHTRTRP